ncbi:hypothetical protein [Arcobacter vandammei]|uniref:hypothetical protein n=1 Tax=Arcobacter vandammei TaxID=2782243 RepID=UPI0018DF4929|nr:hypothetical protein [Arcobacter vandammei]
MKDIVKTQFLSTQRLNVYVDFEEYQHNLKNSKESYVLLCMLEVSLRNSINHCFLENISTNWLENDFLNSNSKNKINEVKQRINKSSNTDIHNKIISELSFGFWTALFRKDYAHIMRIKTIKDIFPNLPKASEKFIDRDYMNKKLNHIRIFRNKVFHYDKIINKKEFENIYNDIYEILGYFDIEIAEFTKKVNCD